MACIDRDTIIYHTETQEDYDALMVELEKQGYEWTRGVSTTIGLHYWERRKYYTCVVVRKGRTLENYTLREVARIYPTVPIQKYKAKADKKMRFTKENVYKLFSQYRKDSNYTLNDLQDEILNLDDATEKVVVPEFVADVFSSELHFEYEIQESRNIPHVLSAAFDEVSSNKNIKFLQWVKQHPDKYVMAVKFGYTIEPDAVTEQRYSVVIADRYLVKLFIGRTDYRFIEFDELCAWKPSAFHLTEKEIKDYDERYWVFAVPVGDKHENNE